VDSLSIMRFPPASRIVPGALGLALAVVAIAASLGSGSGAAAGAANAACSYGVCPSGSGISPTTLDLLLAGLVVVALVLGLLIYRDRRSRGPPPSQPAQPWVDSGGASGGPGGPAGPEAEAAAGGGVAAGAVTSYTETPEDVSVPPPEVPGAAAGAPAAAEGQEGDIDSLMAELDRISGEILKRGQTPKKGAPPATEGEEPKE